MDVMFLGRKTAVWLAGITAIVGAVGLIIVTLGLADPATVATIGGAVVAILAAIIGIIANTILTPVTDPRLPSGTQVTVTDQQGNITGSTKV